MESIRNNYLWLVIPYAITCGTLYLWGYWSSFDINAFEYAGLSDLAKVAIIPVGTTFFFMFLGFLFGEYISIPILPKEGKTADRLHNFISKTRVFWITVYWLVLLSIIFSNSTSKWNILPYFGMIFPYVILKNTAFLIEIKSDSIRSLLIICLSALPIFSFSQGKIHANKIILGNEYKYVESISNEKHAKFIGHIGQYLFFQSLDNSRIILQKANDKPLTLIKNVFNAQNSSGKKRSNDIKQAAAS